MQSKNYDFDDLNVYAGVDEDLEEESYTFGDLAEDYGKFEAVNLTNQGTIIDHGEKELRLRDSRIPEADSQATYINQGLRDAGKNAGKAAGKASLPVLSGVMTVNSGGDPLWVTTSIVSAAGLTNSIRNSALRFLEGLGRRAAKSKMSGAYDKVRVAEEDYEMEVVTDNEFHEEISQLTPEDNVDVREQQMEVQAVPLDQMGQVLESRE